MKIIKSDISFQGELWLMSSDHITMGRIPNHFISPFSYDEQWPNLPTGSFFVFNMTLSLELIYINIHFHVC